MGRCRVFPGCRTAAAGHATAANPPDLPPEALDLERPSAVFTRTREASYSGVIELRENRKVHYLVFDDGLPVHAFFADQRRSDDVREGESLSSRLQRLFQSGRMERLVATGYPEVRRMPVQAPPALLEVYADMMAAAVGTTGAAIGRDAATRCFADALERARQRHAVLRDYRLDEDGRMVGESCAGAPEITSGVATVLFDALTAAERAGATDPALTLQQLAHENRFLLQANGFFERFPWPVGD